MNFDNTKFKALDVRKNGPCTEIDVEIIHDGNRGVAILKLYGPNVKKDNVVTVTKSKESEHQYVIILGRNYFEAFNENISFWQCTN